MIYHLFPNSVDRGEELKGRALYGKVLFLKVCQIKDSQTGAGKKMQYIGFADDTACAKAVSFITGRPNIFIFTSDYIFLCVHHRYEIHICDCVHLSGGIICFQR